MRRSTSSALHPFGSAEDVHEWKEDYSRLKFGSDIVARRFGYAMADAFFERYTARLLAGQCVVIPSPYNYVPNAASVLGRHVADRLSHRLVGAQGAHVEWTTIHRKITYTNDYGFLGKEQRRQLISNDSFYFNDQFVENKTLIFIDDVCITGTHEEKLVELMDDAAMQNECFFLYFGKFVGEGSPDIEASLNFAAVRTLDHFLELRKEHGHHMIVRPIKFLLAQPASEFVRALDQLSWPQARALYNGAVGEGYYHIPAYQENFGVLRQRYLEESTLA